LSGEYDKIVHYAVTENADTRGEKGLSKIIRVVWQWLLALFLLAIGIYYWGLSDVLKVSIAHWSAVGLVFFFTASFTLIHNIRWMSVLRVLLPGTLRKKMDFLQFYQWLMNSYAVGLFVPSDMSLVGVRTFFMKQYKDVRTSTALLSVLLDRFFDVIVLMVVIVSALFLFIGKNKVAMLGAPLIMVGLLYVFLLWKHDDIFTFFIRVYVWAINIVLSLPILRKRQRFEMEISPNASLTRGIVCGLMTWSFVKYILIALRFYAVGLALGVSLTFFDAFFAASLVQLAGFINVTPGGLGIIEMGSYGALKVIGASHPEAVVFAVGQRVLVSSVIVGLAVAINLLMVARSGILKKGSLTEGG
jgi:uncharacterized protein (TIRG00374 family)